MRIKYFLACSVYLGVFCFSALTARAQTEDFFSEKRLFPNTELLNRMPGDGGAQRELRAFADKYERGLYALSGGQTGRAEQYLLEARKSWPEYYATDFALGLLYENDGRPDLAARYYKSYLKKLTLLTRGHYRISGPLMVSMSRGEIESPSIAREFIRQRLYAYGIDLEDVRPAVTVPAFLLPALIGLLAGALFVILRYFAWPAFRLRYRMKHPPEGFWICPSCGSETPELSTECQVCGRPRKPL
ncbi:MAG: hypothetical protein GF408_08035 [Candidatus Omnitrophica bacterium]|nr:hypothetical protein [Candidatus Omnitrophota bacterium]